MFDDLQFAIRTLRKNPGFVLVTLISLALGTGANTAIFSLIDAVMLKMLPVARPEQLVFVNTNAVQSGSLRISSTISLATLEQINSRATTVEGAGAFVVAPKYSVSGLGGQSEVGSPQFVDGAYFESLGIQPVLGRTIRPGDSHASDRIAVLSYGYWQRRFGRDPGVLGRQLTVNRVPFTIAGVLPPEFYGLSLDAPAEILLPRSTAPQVDAGQISASQPEPKDNAGYVFARLKPGASVKQAEAELTLLFRQTEAPLAVGDAVQRASLEKRWIELTPASLGISRVRLQFSQPLKVLMIVVALVLLIACANIANLLLAKATARQREIAIRLSLGSTRWRLIRQLLTESLLLSIAGGMLGLLFAAWARSGIVYLAGDPAIPLHWNLRIVAFTACVTVVNALLFGIAPALRASGVDFTTALRGGRTARAPGRLSLGRALAVVQVALSLSLLIAAALFLETFRNLDRVDLGFARDHGLLAAIDPVIAGRQGAGIRQTYRDVLEQVNSLPGVRSASLIRYRLMGDRLYLNKVRVPGYVLKAGEDPAAMWVLLHEVGPRFFATSGMQLIAGRDFTDRDDEQSPRVAVISEVMAKHFFQHGKPHRAADRARPERPAARDRRRRAECEVHAPAG
jgi:predicted permease